MGVALSHFSCGEGTCGLPLLSPCSSQLLCEGECVGVCASVCGCVCECVCVCVSCPVNG